MKYTASFEGRNRLTYNIEIVTNNDTTTTKELTLVRGGALLQLKSQDNIFAPIKSTMATITVLSNDDISDIYSASAQGTSVAIKQGDNVVFIGYVEPLKLSQPYAARATEVEIVAIDAINSLQYIDFTYFDKPLPTFRDYLSQAMSLASPSVPLTLELTESYDVPLSEMAVSVGNWYDEDGEPCKWSEVLTQLLQYLNLSLVMSGNKVVVRDVRRTVADESMLLDIDALNFTGNSIGSSLTEVYNRLKVSASLYSDDMAFDQLFNPSDESALKPVNGYGNSTLVYKYDDTTNVCDYYTTYTQEGVECSRNDEYGTMVSSKNDWDIESIRQKVGAWLLKRTAVKWPKAYGNSVEGSRLMISSESSKNILLINKLNSMCNGYNAVALEKALNYKDKTLVKITDDSYRAFAGDYVLVLSAKITYSPEMYPKDAAYLPSKCGSKNYSSMLDRALDRFGTHYGTAQYSYIPMRLKIGNKYWKNDNLLNSDDLAQGEWTTAVSTFKAYVALDDNIRYHADLYGEKEIRDEGNDVILYGFENGEWMNNKQFIIRNNVRWDSGIDVRGLMIPISATDMLAGTMELEILTPSSPIEGCVQYLYIEDLKLTICRLSDDGLKAVIDDNSEDDICYQNVADEESVKDTEELTIKVATDAGRKYSRGAVVRVGDSLGYVGQLTSSISGDMMLAEEHLIASRVEQYKQPRNVLEGSLRNTVVDWTNGAKSDNLGKKYVVAGATIDLDNSESKVKLVEIWQKE